MKKIALLVLSITIMGSLLLFCQTVQADSHSNTYITLAKKVFSPNEKIEVKWQNLPGNQKDWIAVVPKKSPDTEWGTWWYTNGKKSGSSMVSELKPGEYEVRVYFNWSQGGYNVQSRSQFNVKEGADKTAPTTIPVPPSIETNTPPQATSKKPVDISGSWYGSKDQRGRLNFWQNGDEFTVVMAWADQDGNWKTYKGEGRLRGRLMEFPVFPACIYGRSGDQGYVYHLTISEDNNEITGYYSRYGSRVDRVFHYYRVK